MHHFKTAAVCFAVVAIFGCERSQPTPPVANNPTPLELPVSADSIGMEFKLIAAGMFTMGEGDGAHEVTLTKPFKMGVHEVTQAQYDQVMKNNPSKFKGAGNPVEMVSWDDAEAFCRKLSELPAEKAAGNVYRLPTEAEWEYACRAGTNSEYSFGAHESNLGEYGWCMENSDEKPHPVGSKLPNAWGLHDMHGNIDEWCSDWFEDHTGGAVTDPTGPASGSLRVLRGGSWKSNAGSASSANRDRLAPSFRDDWLGFRVVRGTVK